MIYIIGNKIGISNQGLWNEGNPYKKNNIYSKESGKLPPVNYDEHILKPHSLTHAESGKHTQNDGLTLDKIIKNHPEYFYGDCLVLKFKSDYKKIGENLYFQSINKNDITNKFDSLNLIHNIPSKILFTTEDYPINENGYHDDKYILVLEQDAADFLCSLANFHLFGTSWKSTDFQPGKFERPIHDTIFQKAVIFELLNLNHVTEGIYTFSGMPLYLENCSESPVTPILISK